MQNKKKKIVYRILKQKEYQYELNLKEYKKKEKKIKEFKNEKKKILLSKRILYEDIQKEKKNSLNKFENLIKKEKRISSSFIKQFFPDIDLSNSQKFNSTKRNYNLGKSLSDINLLKKNQSFSNKLNLSYSSYYKNEIEKKIEELSFRLRKDMNKVIEDEKINEKKRCLEYNNVIEDEDKKKIEEKNNIERENANKKILKMKTDFDKTIKMYEEKLKKDYHVND